MIPFCKFRTGPRQLDAVAVVRRVASDIWRYLSVAGRTLVLTGCLSKPSLQKEQFLIFLLPPSSENASAGRGAGGAVKQDRPVIDEVASLRAVAVAPPFAGRSLVYRISELGYEVDPYAEFLVPPEHMLDGAVRRWLRHAMVFRDVVDLESLAVSTRVLEIQVSDLHGDLRPGQEPAAVLNVRFTLLSTRESGVSTPPVTLEVFRRIPVRDRTADGVVAGMQAALSAALAEFAQKLSVGR